MVGGHFGAAKIYMAVRQRFFWPEMWKAVQDYTTGWETCVLVTQQAGKVVGWLKPLPTAWGRWEQIGVDYISDLPTSLRGNDSIVTFLDHFSKQAHWIPCTETIDSTEFAQAFLLAIIGLHGAPQEIVKECNTCFTSDCCTELSKRLQTKLLISTWFHPQTDGPSEILYKLVTHYPWAFTNYHQDQLDTMLPPAEYVNIKSMHSSTNQSPFRLDPGYTPWIPLNCLAGQRQHENMQSPEGVSFSEQMQGMLLDAQDCLHEAHESQTVESNNSGRPCTLHVVDFAMQSTEDLLSTSENQDPSQRTLQHLWAWSYLNIQVCRWTAVELELPTDITTSHTVSITSLQKYCVNWAEEMPPPPHIQTVRHKDGTIHHSCVIKVIALHQCMPDINGGRKYQITGKARTMAKRPWI